MNIFIDTSAFCLIVSLRPGARFALGLYFACASGDSSRNTPLQNRPAPIEPTMGGFAMKRRDLQSL